MSKKIRKIKKKAVGSLRPNPKNVRRHSPGQIKALANAIRQFGFTNPILVDGGGLVLAGHGRLEAANLLGLEQVPVIELNDLSQEEARAFAIADNKLGDRSSWDWDLLKVELGELASLDLDLDVSLTGFEIGEVDALLGQTPVSEEPVPEPETGKPPVSQLGDLWELGCHLLLCGDALNPESYKRLLGKEMAALAFTDPPYNVKIQGGVVGKGKVKHGNFAMASGEMTPDQFVAFLAGFLHETANVCRSGALLYICMDWRHMDELLAAAKTAELEHKNLCVWEKSNAGMGSLYRSAHELVFVFKKGKAKHVNNVQLGRMGRNRTNVWHYEGVNSIGRKGELELHPTVKPLQMAIDVICDASNRGDVVLDPFGGSGTTLLAGEEMGRRARVIELDPKYLDVAINRYAKRFGTEARLSGTDKTWEEVAAERLLVVEGADG